MSTLEMQAPARPARRPWQLVAGRELRDLWTGGRGLTLLLIGALLFSIVTYLSASQSSLNLLDAKEAVHLLVQVILFVGALMVLLVTADAISGERERRTLEPLLLAPIARRDIVVGKLAAAVSLWVATLAIGVPYVLVLADGPSIAGTSVAAMAILGTLLAVVLACLGTIVSGLSASNRLSLAASFLIVIVLTAPSRVPGITKNQLGDAILHGNPVTSGLRAVEELIVKGASWSDVTGWLISPVIALIVGLAIVGVLAPRLLTLDRS